MLPCCPWVVPGRNSQAGGNVDKSIEKGTVIGMLQGHTGVGQLKEGFNDKSFAVQHTIRSVACCLETASNAS